MVIVTKIDAKIGMLSGAYIIRGSRGGGTLVSNGVKVADKGKCGRLQKLQKMVSYCC